MKNVFVQWMDEDRLGLLYKPVPFWNSRAWLLYCPLMSHIRACCGKMSSKKLRKKYYFNAQIRKSNIN